MTFAIIAAVVFAAFIAALIYAYKTAFYISPRKKFEPFTLPDDEQYRSAKAVISELMTELEAIDFEQVFIKTFDGKKLAARYYHVRDGAPLQIQFHGYRGSALRDFCGGAKLARECGHNVLLVDQRAHAHSEGCTITFGVKERFDCLEWIKYACERFGSDVPIILAGVSMGASTVLMASELDLPENVVGIIADCPYSSPEKIIRKVCGDIGLKPGFIYPLIQLSALALGRFDPRSATVVDSVRKARIPVLIIHGESDQFVPCEMSREIYDVCASPKALLTVPNAAHGMSYIVDPESYRREVEKFLSSVIK
ncbi:MAG: alpha/beta hydrolase [Ruminococcaceae bacterium]|nr:alpha/beta hydrolase [Oscillospiraceae bacterium]